MRRVGYVILFVEDLDRSIAFYRDAIGVPFKLKGDGYAEFATEGTKLALYERGRLEELIGADASPGSPPTSELVFVVEDVDAEHERLDGLGIRILKAPTDRPWGHRTLHVADPDGHVVELAREIPRATSS